MIPLASLPIVVIFERHWDEKPKQLVNKLIPKLAEEGYDTLCFEAPHNRNEDEILSSHRDGLALDSQINSQAHEYIEKAGIKNIKLCDLGFVELTDLMKEHVSSQRYLEVAEKIKALPASILLKDTFNIAKKFSFRIKGIDIESNDYHHMMSHDLSQRIKVIENLETYRISTFFENLLKLQQEGKGVAFVCGALHAENLINRFKEKNLQNHILYYFAHSTKKYTNNFDDIEEYSSNEILKNHMFCLTNKNDENSLLQKIIKEIKSNNTTYKEEIVGGNAHSKFLSKFFNKDFKAFMRPGYYVDALLDADNVDDCKHVVEKLQQVNISTHNISMQDKNYLVVQDVNTKEISDNILRLN